MLTRRLLEETEHELHIESLRDTVARCSCGGWEYVSIPSDGETDEQIRAEVEAEFQRHDRA
jgi:hypothetical protein